MSKQCKVILLGEAGVGKTCIITRYVKNMFDEKVSATLGSSFSTKEVKIKGKKFVLNLWDTSGSEQYRAFNKIFYRDAAIVVLVFDILNRHTFEELKNYWLDEVRKEIGENIVIGIAGNKYDLFKDQQVSEEEAKEFAKEINAKCFFVSACTGDSIDELFFQLLEEYADHYAEKDNKSKNTDFKFDDDYEGTGGSFTLNEKDKDDIKEKKQCCS